MEKSVKNITQAAEIKKWPLFSVQRQKWCCPYCPKTYSIRKSAFDHFRRGCKHRFPSIKLYRWDNKYFGKNVYGKGGGDIYIMQTNNCGWDEKKKIFKIGIVKSLYKLLYKARGDGSTHIPRIYYFYPIKDVAAIESHLAVALGAARKNAQEELYVEEGYYKGDLEMFRQKIKDVQEETDNKIVEREPIIIDSAALITPYCPWRVRMEKKPKASNEDIFHHINECKFHRECLRIAGKE